MASEIPQNINDLNRLIDERAKKIAAEVYSDQNRQYGVTKIPYHVHNGTDSAPVNESNLTLGTKLHSVLNTTVSAVFTLRNVPNVRRIAFHYLGSDGVDVSAGQGEAIFGKCYGFSGTDEDIVITTSGAGVPFMQGCSVLKALAAGGGKAAISNLYIAALPDGDAIIELVSYNNGTLTFAATVQPGTEFHADIMIS